MFDFQSMPPGHREPEGFTDSSRWLSVAIPPVEESPQLFSTPEGVPAATAVRSRHIRSVGTIGVHAIDHTPSIIRTDDDIQWIWHPFRVRDLWGSRIPVVSLRSTTGYHREPLRGSLSMLNRPAQSMSENVCPAT